MMVIGFSSWLVKIGSIILFLTLLLFTCLNKVQAEGVVTLSGQPSTINARVGDTVIVDVVVNTNGDKVSAIKLHLNYDQAALQGQSISGGTVLPLILKAGVIGDGNASITLGSQPTTPITETATVATLNFKALKAGRTSVSFTGDTETVSKDKTGFTLGTTSGTTVNITGSAATSAPIASPTDPATKSPSLPPAPTPAPPSSPNPIVGRVTVDFDDLSAKDSVLNGTYPAGRVNWGTNLWYLSSPWELFKTKSISFNGPAGISDANINLLVPGHLESLQAYNGGILPSTISLSCSGKTTITVTINPKIAPTTIQTGWTGDCPNFAVSSSNGWNTNFDNLVLAAPDTNPLITPMPIPTPNSTSVPTEQTISFDDTKFKNKLMNGQFPSGVIDWGYNKWFLSGPWKKFTTKSFSFANGGIKTAQFKFVTPKTLISLKAYNGGQKSTNLAISCAGQQTKSLTLAAGQPISISTGWVIPCSPVTINSSNSWDTNFDDLIIK